VHAQLSDSCALGVCLRDQQEDHKANESQRT
jgi:hypothetical protein